ncbi:MAG: HEPN domain-containing protein [Ruminococcaceae bacterium]|nr:HEPN domain-containing protein [Oscillospiraceae bacterium]
MARRKSRDSKIYTEWMVYAENDLRAANLLKRNKHTLLLSAFHSHQAIEKALKAFMLAQKGYAPDGHNIIFLAKTAAKVNPGFFDWIDECIALNNYYIQTRYPPDFPLVLDKTATNNLAVMATDLYKFTLNELAKFE